MPSIYAQTQKVIVSGVNKAPKIYSISGTILESSAKKPLEFASASLLTVKDSTLVKGGVTNTKGCFHF